MCLSMLRDSTSVDVKLCKTQKTTNFTHFVLKIFHISLFKTVYIYTFATVTMHICTVTVNVYPIILLISCLLLFFLSSLCTTNSVTSPFLIFFFLKYTQTHPHTNKPTRTNQQRDKSVLNWNN